MRIAADGQTLDAAPIAAAAAAPAALVSAAAMVILIAGAPIAWLWLTVCAAATLPVAVWGFASGRFFEPLPLLASVCALLFVVRPLQLFSGWRDLYSAFSPSDPIDRMVLLDGQEMARFVSERLQEPIDSAFARATGACALFLVALLIGYRLGLGGRAAERLAVLRGPTGSLNVRAAIAASLLIGLAAQAVIIVRSDGPAASFENASEQAALSQSFALFVMAGFATAGLIVWAAWMRPRSSRGWAAFLFSVLSVCAFAVAAGSRSRVFVALLVLALIVHYLWRPWRRRELALALLLGLAFVSSFLVFREVSERRSLREAAEVAPRHVLDARVILNDITSFDHVVYADHDLRPRARPRERPFPDRRRALVRAPSHRFRQARGRRHHLSKGGLGGHLDRRAPTYGGR